MKLYVLCVDVTLLSGAGLSNFLLLSKQTLHI